MNGLHSFFAAKHFAELPENHLDNPLQIGNKIQALTADNDDWANAEIVLVGCGEQRGHQGRASVSYAPDAIRDALYKMYDWHTEIKVADTGNLLQGASVDDSKAALLSVLQELHQDGKIAVLLGGSQDLTLQQYNAFKKSNQVIDAAVIDMLIDLNETEMTDDTSYLMDMLTSQPNFIRNYAHIGFQSYYVNPNLLETLDRLRFDCYRLGRVREDLQDMEPVLRQCDMLSVDMNAVRYSDAPFLEQASPNGFFGDELCQLMRYAGMSAKLSSLGIYGYIPEKDKNRLGAQLIAQMIWYFVDGYLVRKQEAPLNDKDAFYKYDVVFTGNDTSFLKSKRTGRWWMRLPDGNYVPCSYKDYTAAANGDMPERWMREQERFV